MVQHVYAVAGAKGGVGKTTTSINLGTAFAELGWSAVVVETDLAMANVVDFLDLDADPRVDATLHDVLGGDAAIEEATYGAPGDADVVPSGVDLEGFAAADLRRLGEAIEALRASYDVILLDAGAGLSRETLYPPAIADSTILVSSPRVASVRDAEKTKVLTERVGGEIEGALFVESGTGTAPPVEHIADFLGVDLLGHVPEDEAVPTSQDAGRPVLLHAEDAPAATAYRDVAADLETALLDRSPTIEPTPADSGPSTVEPDGGTEVAVGEAPEEPSTETLARATDAADLLEDGADLEAEGSVRDLWESVDATGDGEADGVAGRARPDETGPGDDSTSEGMPDPPSASAPIGGGSDPTDGSSGGDVPAPESDGATKGPEGSPGNETDDRVLEPSNEGATADLDQSARANAAGTDGNGSPEKAETTGSSLGGRVRRFLGSFL